MRGFIEILAMFAAIIAGTLLLSAQVTPSTINANDILETGAVLSNYELNLKKSVMSCNWLNQDELSSCININSSKILSNLNLQIHNCNTSIKEIKIESLNRSVITKIDCNRIKLTNGLQKLNISKIINLTKNRALDNLVLYVKANNDTNDYSGNVIRPSFSSTNPTKGIDNSNNSAIEYKTNTNYTKYDFNDLLNTQYKLSISFWINPTELNETTIIQYSTQTTNGVTIKKNVNDLIVNLIDTTNTNHEILVNNALKTNEWTNIIVIFNNNTAKLFINGEKIRETTIGSVTLKTNSDLYFAKNPLNETISPRIKLDEIMIFNKGLSDTEAQYIYQSQKP